MKKQILPRRLVSFAFLCVLAAHLHGADAAPATAADQAWEQLRKAVRPPSPPAEWGNKPPNQEQREEFRKLMAEKAAEAAGKAKSFHEANPDHKQAAEAKRLEKKMLETAARYGNQGATAPKKLDLLGNPLAMRFTAVDGREIDLAQLKGKVLLIDFWATWCGPCVAELPNVKAAYVKLHPKGFEIIGISFDNDKQALTGFVEKEKMTWPQFFDGKGWGNAFGKEYGINSIPTMWLIDRKGNVRDLDARGALEEKVAQLLAESE